MKAYLSFRTIGFYRRAKPKSFSNFSGSKRQESINSILNRNKSMNGKIHIKIGITVNILSKYISVWNAIRTWFDSSHLRIAFKSLSQFNGQKMNKTSSVDDLNVFKCNYQNCFKCLQLLKRIQDVINNIKNDVV